MDDWKRLIRDVPDFPKPGILFRDITPLLGSPQALGEVVAAFAERYKSRGITRIVAIESRGFIFGAPLALHMGVGFSPVRKPGKLPAKTVSVTYDLEYGEGTLQMHEDAVTKVDRVLVIDDLLATGGTAEAAARLVTTCGASVAEFAFVIELDFLKGRGRLDKVAPVHSLIRY
ncbi:MAG: adenine phosphoribosyltransferase [Deltaproteobacteria bacterium]|nr:adenine phosphoribosyltransferase [Deltaproteobacteria bacterium]